MQKCNFMYAYAKKILVGTVTQIIECPKKPGVHAMVSHKV